MDMRYRWLALFGLVLVLGGGGLAYAAPKLITGEQVQDDSLTGADVLESSLVLPPAQVQVSYRTATVTVPAAPNATESTPGVATARCDPGQRVTGGGAELDDVMSVVDSYPDEGGAGWTANVNNDDPLGARTATVHAVCVPASTPG
jgi:hypothetical protein